MYTHISTYTDMQIYKDYIDSQMTDDRKMIDNDKEIKLSQNII